MTRIADLVRPECPVFYVDNVAEYMWSHDKMTRETFTVPGCVPAFESAWFEFGMPPIEPGRRYAHMAFMANTSRDEDGWLVTSQMYYMEGVDISQAPAALVVRLDHEGQIVSADASDDGDAISGTVLAWPMFLACAFMHCKNVRTVEHVPAGPFERAKRRRGEPPSLKYHVLEIDPMRTVLKREGKVDEVGIARALHICRGHFRTYDETKRLFGRLTGTFWVPAHVRGNPSEGVVVKDYSVKSPNPNNETVR